jgi:putative peptidoglycan lipid II flippase
MSHENQPHTPTASAPTSAAAASTAGQEQAKSTGIVSLAIMCSRVLGLVRDMLLNGLFGTAYTGIFNRAFGTPNMLRDLFAEGALSTSFVTNFSRLMKTEGDESAWRLARKMLTLAFFFMILITGAGILIAPYLIHILVPGWSAESKALTVSLAQTMYPFIIIISLTALVMGMLNSKKVFFIPAVASAFFNLGCIVGGLALAWMMDSSFRSGQGITSKSLYGFALGTLIGGALQLLVQLPALKKVGFRFRPDFQWKDEGVNSVLKLMWPSMIAAGGTQINVLLNSIFASFTPGQEAAQAWLGNAQRLQQLPLGIFGVAVATVTLPAISRAAATGITPEFRSTLSKGVRLVLFLTLPCAIGLSLLAEPIISVLFQRGKFTLHDTQQCAAALVPYAFGLIFYAGIKVIQPAFYAINKRFLPMIVSVIVIVLNVVMNSTTVFYLKWDHSALAWATAIGLLLNFSILYAMMNEYTRGIHSRKLLGMLGRLFVGLLALAACCALAQRYLMTEWESFSLIRRLFTLGLTISFAGLVYFVCAVKLGVEEARDFTSIISRKLGLKKATPPAA